MEGSARPARQLTAPGKHSKLSKQERERMKRRFERMAGRTPPVDKLDLKDFVGVPELAGNPLMIRVFELLDTDGDGQSSYGTELDVLLPCTTLFFRVLFPERTCTSFER